MIIVLVEHELFSGRLGNIQIILTQHLLRLRSFLDGHTNIIMVRRIKTYSEYTHQVFILVLQVRQVRQVLSYTSKRQAQHLRQVLLEFGMLVQ